MFVDQRFLIADLYVNKRIQIEINFSLLKLPLIFDCRLKH
jgi:hypothetical protein